jgi:hypothetical protein
MCSLMAMVVVTVRETLSARTMRSTIRQSILGGASMHSRNHTRNLELMADLMRLCLTCQVW